MVLLSLYYCVCKTPLTCYCSQLYFRNLQQLPLLFFMTHQQPFGSLYTTHSHPLPTLSPGFEPFFHRTPAHSQSCQHCLNEKHFLMSSRALHSDSLSSFISFPLSYLFLFHIFPPSAQMVKWLPHCVIGFYKRRFRTHRFEIRLKRRISCAISDMVQQGKMVKMR